MQFRNFHLGKLVSLVGENSQTTRPKFLWATTWFVVADRVLPIGIFLANFRIFNQRSERMGLGADCIRVLSGSVPPTTIATQSTSICTLPNYGKCLPIYVHRDRWIDTSVTIANGSENAIGKRTNETRVRQVGYL